MWDNHNLKRMATSLLFATLCLFFVKSSEESVCVQIDNDGSTKQPECSSEGQCPAPAPKSYRTTPGPPPQQFWVTFEVNLSLWSLNRKVQTMNTKNRMIRQNITTMVVTVRGKERWRHDNLWELVLICSCLHYHFEWQIQEYYCHNEIIQALMSVINSIIDGQVSWTDLTQI